MMWYNLISRFYLRTDARYMTATSLLLLLVVHLLQYSFNRSMAAFCAEKRIVILGGGIHGASIAFYLTEMGAARPIIIEKSAIAAAASGKAGGFLAREWGSGPTIQLHQSSYDLHAELAKTLHISSYRAIPTLSVNGNRKGIVGATWLDGRASSSPMEGATAQVTPLELTSKLIEAAKSKGADVLFETVEGLLIERGEVKGVRLKGRDPLPADIVIIAMGPWSAPLIEDNFRIPLPMQGIKSTSILYTNLDEIRTEPYACFCAEDRNGCHLELYPRTNGDLYICGCGGSDYVEVDRLREGGDCDSAEKILADPDRVAAATASFQDMSSIGSRHVPSIKQACMRPCASDALPVMGEIPGFKGAYVSTAHNCWGILWAPASGKAIAELVILGESRLIDLSPFSIARFMPSKTGERGRKMGNVDVGEQW